MRWGVCEIARHTFAEISVDYSGNAEFDGSTPATLEEIIKRKPAKKPTKK
jgi:hypothetical protein